MSTVNAPLWNQPSSWTQHLFPQVLNRKQEVDSAEVVSPSKINIISVLVATYLTSHCHPQHIQTYQGQRSPHTRPNKQKQCRNR